VRDVEDGLADAPQSPGAEVVEKDRKDDGREEAEQEPEQTDRDRVEQNPADVPDLPELPEVLEPDPLAAKDAAGELVVLERDKYLKSDGK